MRFAILNTDYPAFMRGLYLSQPGLHQASYAEQMDARNASLFGVANFYSRNFIAHGHEAIELHLNNPWLQYAWARENDLNVAPPPPPVPFAARDGNGVRRTVIPSRPSFRRLLRERLKPVVGPLLRPALRRLRPQIREVREWENEILSAQISAFNPDVILNQDMAYMRSTALKDLKRVGILLIGQIASSLPDDDFGIYDLVISSLPNQVAWFRERHVKAELNRLAFDPVVLEQMGPPPVRDIPLSFVGSLSPDHLDRIAFLEYLATRTPLKVWGTGIERLQKSSPLHACYQGEAWGSDMYQVLRRSKITLNFHVDLAEDWANNMRLYEATGAGALLLTDQKRNLAEIFVPGEHVAVYSGQLDCVRQISKLLADDVTRERISAAGQLHTIATQNYFLRTGEIAALAQANIRPS